MQKFLFQQFFSRLKSKTFQITYWDGMTEKYGEGDGDPCFTLVFHEKFPTLKLIDDPIMTLGEAYMDGLVDINGEMEEFIRVAYSNKEIFWKGRLPRLPKVSLRKQKENVQHHYDLGNDFYSLWLDETMSYSCAYFQTPEDSLEQAQMQKIDHTLKKLQLKPGETLLDIGSGWGWLILRAAEQYGVKSMGITLSEEQYKMTQERIKDLGLQGRVEVDLISFSEFAEKGRVFDKIASVGMFEHVGQAYYPQFMKSVHSLLKERGLALLHSITKPLEQPTDPWITKYIFPGGHIPSLREIIRLLPDYNFHPIDMESLRLHYAMTLDRWGDRFEEHVDKIKEMYDERFVRMWHLYLRTCAASFRVSGLNIHQILFSKGLNNDLFLTRDHLYRAIE
jgi:cyclopropane-fatty-acyl-phospholipid synthase